VKFEAICAGLFDVPVMAMLREKREKAAISSEHEEQSENTPQLQ
jgi:hypothetical protein